MRAAADIGRKAKVLGRPVDRASNLSQGSCAGCWRLDIDLCRASRRRVVTGLRVRRSAAWYLPSRCVKPGPPSCLRRKLKADPLKADSSKLLYNLLMDWHVLDPIYAAGPPQASLEERGTLSRPYAGPPDLGHRRRGNARITTHSRARTKKAASRENRTMAFEFSPRAEEALSSQFIAPDAQGGFFGAAARMSPRSSPAEAATRRSQARPCRGLDLMKRVKKEL